MSPTQLPTEFSGPNDSPGFLLWRVSNAWQKEQRHALQQFGITHTQFVALAVATWFGEHEPMTQARLAQLTGSDPMTTSQVVRVLEKLGYFERTSHPNDTRAKIITVSPSGKEIAANAVKIVEATDKAFFSVLGSDTQLITKLFQLLLKQVAPSSND